MIAVDYSDMLGAPFKLGGRSLVSGIDCFGLLQVYFARAGFDVPDPFWNYEGDEVRSGARALAAFGDLWESSDGSRVGDVAMLRQGREERSLLHVGVRVPEDRLLHSLKGVGVASTALRHYEHLVMAWYRLRAAA